MSAKKKPEYIEGDEAFENFDKALGEVLKVPHSEIKAKLEAEKKAKPPRKAISKKKPAK